MVGDSFNSFVNLTPHAIVLRSSDGKETTIPPSGIVARVSAIEESRPDIQGIPAIHRRWGPVNFGIELAADHIYLVSSLVLSGLESHSAMIPSHAVIAAPDTGDTAIRHDKGQIKAVTRLVMLR